MVDLKELSLVSGKAAWMAFLVSLKFYCLDDHGQVTNVAICVIQDIYCLDADGAVFDAALLSATVALSHCKCCIFCVTQSYCELFRSLNKLFFLCHSLKIRVSLWTLLQ